MGSCFGHQKDDKQVDNEDSSALTSTPIKPKPKQTSTPPEPKPKQTTVANESDLTVNSTDNISSPSQIPTTDLTNVYILPTKEFKTEEDVIKAHGYEILNEIAKGGFGKVYKARRLFDDLIIGCKILDFTRDNDEKHRTDIKSELFVLERTSHPNVIKLYEHFMIRSKTRVCIYIWMQFAPLDSLSRYMREASDPMDEEMAQRMFAQIVAGVRHVHLKHIAHRDLKMGNILLDKGMHVLVSDFGLSRVTYRMSKGGTVMSYAYCGTVPYMAPEILMNRVKKTVAYDPFISDVWAMGIILYIMYNKAYPFNEDNGFDDMIETQMNSKWKFSKLMKSKPSAQLDDILRRLLEPHCNKRVTIGQLAHHSWIRHQIKDIPL